MRPRVKLEKPKEEKNKMYESSGKKLTMRNINFSGGRVSYDLFLDGNERPLAEKVINGVFPRRSNLRRTLYYLARTAKSPELKLSELEPFSVLLNNA